MFYLFVFRLGSLAVIVEVLFMLQINKPHSDNYMSLYCVHLYCTGNVST